MKKIAITGANGFVGRHLTSYLSSFPYEIVCLTSSTVSISCPHINYVRVDYADSSSIISALVGCDALVHLASVAHINTFDKSVSNSFRFLDHNLTILSAVLTCLRFTKISHFIFLSSIGVYGDEFVSSNYIIDEASPYNPCHPYSLSKIICEHVLTLHCSALDINWTILQPPLVYSPDAPGNFSRIYMFFSKTPILPFAGLNKTRSFISVGNLCSAIHTCIHNPLVFNDIFILSDTVDISLSRIEFILSRHFNRRFYFSFPVCFLLQPLFLVTPIARAYWNKLNANISVSSDKFVLKTGWKPPEPPFSCF